MKLVFLSRKSTTRDIIPSSIRLERYFIDRKWIISKSVFEEIRTPSTKSQRKTLQNVHSFLFLPLPQLYYLTYAIICKLTDYLCFVFVFLTCISHFNGTFTQIHKYKRGSNKRIFIITEYLQMETGSDVMWSETLLCNLLVNMIINEEAGSLLQT